MELNAKDIKRFWNKVNIVNDASSCWEWQACLMGHGYGNMRLKNKMIGAHRISWVIHSGFIPKGMLVLHKCDNPKCVRPDHLFLGTHKDNMIDMNRKGRGKFSSGENNGNSKITMESVRWIRDRYASGRWSQAELADICGLDQTQVGHIVSNEQWRNPEYHRETVSTAHKLDMDKAKEIRELYRTGQANQRQIAEQFNVHKSLVSLVVRNKIWREQ